MMIGIPNLGIPIIMESALPLAMSFNEKVPHNTKLAAGKLWGDTLLKIEKRKLSCGTQRS